MPTKLKIEDIAYMDMRDVDQVKLLNTMRSHLTVLVRVGTPVDDAFEQWRRARRGGVVLVVSEENQPIGMVDLGKVLPKDAAPTLSEEEWLRSLKELRELRIGRPIEIYCERGQHLADGNPCSEHAE